MLGSSLSCTTQEMASLEAVALQHNSYTPQEPSLFAYSPITRLNKQVP